MSDVQEQTRTGEADGQTVFSVRTRAGAGAGRWRRYVRGGTARGFVGEHIDATLARNSDHAIEIAKVVANDRHGGGECVVVREVGEEARLVGWLVCVGV